MIALMQKVVIGLSLLILMFINVPAISVSADESSPSTVLENGKISNVVDRFLEKINMFFKFSTKDKIDYQKKLTEKRLAELKFAIEDGQGDLIEELTSRYSTYLGNLTEMVIKNKAVDRKQEFVDMYSRHYGVLDELDTRFESNSGFWLLMEHDKNYTKIYSDQIKGM